MLDSEEHALRLFRGTQERVWYNKAMTRLEELILFILDRAHKEGIKDLSRFQLFKIPYIIQVMSLKYAGTEFVPGATFIRDKNGPISTDIYSAIKHLIGDEYVDISITKHEGYDYPRYGHKLAKKLPKLSFSEAETIFLDNFLSELLPLPQKKLKERAYATEPMKEMTKQEKGEIKKGAVLNFSTVMVDSDVVDAYSDTA
ncbi:MAG: Panacea domain-containing protein [Nitrospirota bacterium]